MLNLCSPERTVRRNLHLACVLTVVAGILNSGGFVAVARYTSHMTGIVASMADAIALGLPDLVAVGALALTAFVLGAVACALVFNWGRVRGLRSRYVNILLLEGMGMLLFGLLAERPQDAHRSVVMVGVLCFTMGLQNALITRIGEWPVRTTHITGMVTDIGVEIGKALYRSPADAADPVVGEPRRIAALAGLVALFFLGGMAGALGYLWLGFEVVVPVAAVLLLIAHRPLVQDLREAWLRRRPRRPSGRGPRSAR